MPDSIRDATVSTTPLELVVLTTETAVVHPLPMTGCVTVGRSPDNQVRIDHASVSRRHAVFHMGSPVYLEDLGSQNGISVRSREPPVGSLETTPWQTISRKSIPIHIGEHINIGSVLVMLRKQRVARVAGDVDFVARSPATATIVDLCLRAATSPLTVLLLGETGVGKEVLARAIHERSPRAKGPFVALNCAAFTETLIEGELFGHEKGAHSTAHRAKPGLFEVADKGTMFLDEVGEMPFTMQAKLLRVIQERKVLRVGGSALRSIDVRFVAATNRNLEAEVRRNRFREDLFHRLNQVMISIPPLRERVADIPHLAQRFVSEACAQINRVLQPVIAPETMALLERYPWPGNVRELLNVIYNAVMLNTDDKVRPDHLPARLAASPSWLPQSGFGPVPSPLRGPRCEEAERLTPVRALATERDEKERETIIAALEAAAGNQHRAAEMLGIARRALLYKLHKYNIPRPRKGTDPDDDDD